MNLIFEKKNPQLIEVKIHQKDSIYDFDYIAFLKGLLACGSLGNSELKGEFSEFEKNSIESMIRHLNECVPVKKGQVDLDGD